MNSSQRTRMHPCAPHNGLAAACVDRDDSPRAAPKLPRTGEVSEGNPAEDAPTAGEKELRKVLDGLAPNLFAALLTPDGVLTAVSRSALAAGNLSSGDVVGKPFADTYWWNYSEDVRSQLRTAIQRAAAGTASRYDVQVRVADGRLIWIDFSLVPFLDESGQVAYLIPSAVDVTERKRTEEALSESRLRFRELAENIRDVFWLTDPAKNSMLYVSSAYERIWGYTRDSLYASPRSWLDAIHPQDRERVLEAAQTRQATGEYDEEYRIVRPDGAIRWIRDRAFPVKDRDGKVYRIAGIAEDVTERKRAQTALLESEHRFRQVVKQSPDAVLIHQEGTVVFVNEAMLRLMRASGAEQLAGRSATSMVHPERAASAEERIHALYSGRNLPLVEQQYVRSDGTVVDVEVAAAPFTLEGKPAALVTVRDITLRKEQEQRIARLSRIRAVLSGINSAIVRIRDRNEMFREACRIAVTEGAFKMAWVGVIDPDTLYGKVVACSGEARNYIENIRLTARAGMPYSDRPACRAVREMHPVIVNDIAREPGLASLSAELTECGHHSTAAFPLIVGNRAYAVLVLHAAQADFFDDEECRLLAELAKDISFNLEYIEKEENLRYLAYYDALTGLPNRTLLLDRLGQTLHAAQRDRALAALILMDIERFHLINETLGRSTADNVLKEVARRLQLAVRAEDTVARIAGDRFALTLAGVNTTAEITHFLRDRLMPVLRDPVDCDGQALRLSARFAIAFFPPDGGTPEVLMSNAETALKKTKERGEKFLFYAPDMNARVAESLKLENRLRNALEQNQFVLYYQPKVTVNDRRLIGFEALIRWNDPELGIVPPAKFIPLMEETGLIVDAGRWALSQVARDCRRWAGMGLQPPSVAVNVSPLQLRQKDFVDNVVEAAQAIQHVNGGLNIEITESVIMENVEAIARKLQTLRGLGVEISVDDFGTGYSSLAYVARLPISALKIDRSFVLGMTQNSEHLLIVKSIVSLAHSLHLQVVAEGVETEEQVAQLESLGCDQMQGYLFSRPIPPQEVPGMLRGRDQRAHK